MRKLILALIVAVALTALVGCGGNEETAGTSTGYAPGQEVEAYDYVHGGYVGQAVVSTDDEGNLEVSLNEAFLPHTLATVDMDSDQWSKENTITYTAHGRTSNLAKYVVYNGTTYVGTTFGTNSVWVEADEEGNPAGNTSLEMAIIRNEDTMRSYYNGIQNGAFQIMTEFGGEPMAVETTPYGSLTKRGSEYWAEGGHGLGWHANIDAIETAAEEQGVSYTYGEMSRNDDNKWQLADTVTGATASDFQEYFALVQLAAARLDRQ
jgi:hypothetical protein